MTFVFGYFLKECFFASFCGADEMVCVPRRGTLLQGEGDFTKVPVDIFSQTDTKLLRKNACVIVCNSY